MLPFTAAAAVVVILSACSSSTPSPQNATDGASVTDGGGSSKPVAVPKASADDGQTPFNASDRELTHRDCQTLGGRYRALVVSDESTKLDPTLDDIKREQGSEAIAKGADVLSGRWTDSCEAALVGKFASEEALQCAMTSKTVKAFDVCLNGPPVAPKK